jgi:hypothetical protein
MRVEGRRRYNICMRRRLSVAALVAAFAVIPAWAQMRGGRPSVGVARPGMAARGPVLVSRHLGFAPGARTSVHFTTGFRQPFFPHRFHHRRFLFASFPWWYYGYYPSGYYGAYSYPFYGDAYSSDDSSRAYYDQNRELAGEVSRLSDEVEHLREELETRSIAPPSPPQPPVPSQPQAAKPDAHTSTVLVFRDKRTQEVQNYAVVGPTLWIFDETRAKKLAVADLDIPATTRLNDERGVEFRLPK